MAAPYLELSICHLMTACQAQAGIRGFRSCTIIQAHSQKVALWALSFLKTVDQQAQTLPQKGKQPSQDHLSKLFGEVKAQDKLTPSLGEK